MLDKRLLQNFHWGLAVLTLLLAGAGLLTVYSAMAPFGRGGAHPLFIRQAIWVGLGLAAMAVALLPSYTAIQRRIWWIYGGAVFLLVCVLFTGKVVSGSQRWLSIGPLTVQPSEFAKLAVLVMLADHYSRAATGPGLSLKELFWPGVLTGVPFVLVLLEPDLGTAMMIALVAGSMTLFAGVRPRTLLTAAGAGLCAAPLAWFFLLKDYQKERILTFLDPGRDPLGAGYHIIQSKIAIGSGMLLGKGYLEGTQKALSFLPEQHTDFIFCVLAEEWGFAGGAVLVGLFFLWFMAGLSIALKSKDPFGAMLAVGIICMIFWQAFINIGMVMGLFPVVGVPLPLVSYGGSSILVTMLGVGILLSVGMRRFMFE